MTSYTTPHSLPIIEPTVNKIASAGTTNLAGDINALASATQRGFLAESSKVDLSQSAQDATITNQGTRLAAVEVLGGLAPGDVNDATAASLITNPGTQTNTALNAAIDPKVAPKLDKSEAVATYSTKETIDAAADPLAYLNNMDVFCQFNARPAGTLWPQGFSINEAAQELYVGMNGSLDGGTTASLRISVRNFDGSVKSEKTIVVEAGTSSEGLPWFYGAGGDLCFIIRPATAGVGYAVYNYTQDTKGPTIPIKGNYKSDVDGLLFVTCDQVSSGSGVGAVYLYDWASVQAGAPVLLDTVYLEARNMLNKVQSFAINAGNIIFSHGASKTEPHLSVYTLAGKLVTMHQLDKPTFADAINKYAPGTITNRLSYRHESEGAATVSGKLLTGHVTDNNSSAYTFTIMRHNQVDGARVIALGQPPQFDTGWLPLSLSGTVVSYSAGSPPEVRRIGKLIYLRGAVKGVAATPSSALIGTLPAGFAPSANAVASQVTSGAFTANWQINTAGTIYVLNSQNTSASTSSWYPLPNIVWPVD